MGQWLCQPAHGLLSVPCPQSNALPSHVKISVSRQTLFEDSFQQVRGAGSGGAELALARSPR